MVRAELQGTGSTVQGAGLRSSNAAFEPDFLAGSPQRFVPLQVAVGGVEVIESTRGSGGVEFGFGIGGFAAKVIAQQGVSCREVTILQGFPYRVQATISLDGRDRQPAEQDDHAEDRSEDDSARQSSSHGERVGVKDRPSVEVRRSNYLAVTPRSISFVPSTISLTVFDSVLYRAGMMFSSIFWLSYSGPVMPVFGIATVL